MFATLISGTKHSISKGKGAANHHTTSCQGNCFTKPDHQTTGMPYKCRISTSVIQIVVLLLNSKIGFRDHNL